MGIRVLDLSRLVAGNMLSLQLGDFGADVVKVEPPEGDPLREWRDDGKSLHWKTYCRNKRSIVLNLRHAAAKDALLRLVAKADVLIENYRPGTLEEMGLGPTSCTSQSQPGHRARVRLRPDRPLRAAARLRHAGRGDERLRLAHRISRSRAGAAAAGARRHDCGRLWRVRHGDRAAGARQRHGKGQVIDLSLLESVFSVLGPEAGIYAITGKVKERSGSASNTSSPRNVYRCSDGHYIAVSASIQAMAKRLFESIGRPDMIEDPRFRTNTDRVKQSHAGGRSGRRLVRHQDPRRGAAHHARGERHRRPGLFHRRRDARTRTSASASIIVDVEDAELGKLPMHNILPRLSETPGVWQKPAPGLGEHTDAVLAEAGLSADEIARLRKDGAAA